MEKTITQIMREASNKKFGTRYSNIIHFSIEKEIYPLQRFYLCNQAVLANGNKLTSDINKVNCKNCLKQLKKRSSLKETKVK